MPRTDTSTEPTWQFTGNDQLPDDLICALAALLLDADPDAAVSVLTNQGNQDDRPG